MFESSQLKLGKYKHYKGKTYEVVGIACHSETQEKMVVYKALYNEKELWVRPLKMFLEKVENNGQIVQRFKYVI